MRKLTSLAVIIGALASAPATIAATLGPMDFTGASGTGIWIQNGLKLTNTDIDNSANCPGGNESKPCTLLNSGSQDAQLLTTESGDPFYIRSFDYNFAGNNGVLHVTPTPDGVSFFVSEASVTGSAQVCDKGLTGCTFIFAPNTLITSLLFSDLTNGGGTVRIDNIRVAPVPVPAAVILFGTALAGLGFMSRRKRVHAAA
jgi:hypothetical protein